MEVSDEVLTEGNDAIRNETVFGSITKEEVADQLQNMTDSKVNKSRLGITNIAEDFLDPNGPDDLPAFTYRIANDGDYAMQDEFGANGLFKLYRPGSGLADTSLYSKYPIQLGAGRKVAIEMRINVIQLLDVLGNGNGDMWLGLIPEGEFTSDGEQSGVMVGGSVFQGEWQFGTFSGSIEGGLPELPFVLDEWVIIRIEINEDFTELVYYFNDIRLKVTSMSNVPKSTQEQYLEFRAGVKCWASGVGNYEVNVDYITIQIF